MSAPVAPAPVSPAAPAAPVPPPAPAPAAAVPAAPVAPAPAAAPPEQTLEAQLAALTVQQPETWTPPGEEPAAPAAEATPTPEAPAPAAPTFEVELPSHRLNADGKRDTLKIKVGSQAEADTARYHLKRSAQVDQLQTELQERQSDKTTVDFFDQQPREAFAFLADVKPQAARDFIGAYLAANPQLAAETLTALGYTVVTQEDPEALAAKAELAQIKLREQTHQARIAHERSAEQQSYFQTAGSVIREVGSTAGLDLGSDDFRTFAQIASQSINQRFPQGATRDELALALQPLVQRVMLMLGKGAPVPAAATAPSMATPPSTPSPETFAQRDQQMARFAGVQGGQTLASVLAPEAAPKAETLEQMISRLGG